METLGLEDRIVVALRRLTRAIALHSRELLQRCGLTDPQLATLPTTEWLRPVNVGATVPSIHLSRARVTGVLDRLARRGPIRGVQDGDDGRSAAVEPTTSQFEGKPPTRRQ